MITSISLVEEYWWHFHQFGYRRNMNIFCSVHMKASRLRWGTFQTEASNWSWGTRRMQKLQQVCRRKRRNLFRIRPRVKPVCVSPKGTLDKVKSLCKSGSVWDYFPFSEKVNHWAENTTSPRGRPSHCMNDHDTPPETLQCVRCYIGSQYLEYGNISEQSSLPPEQNSRTLNLKCVFISLRQEDACMEKPCLSMHTFVLGFKEDVQKKLKKIQHSCKCKNRQP